MNIKKGWFKLKFSRKVIFRSVCYFIIGLIIIGHITPAVSIRTHIFVTGHPLSAFRGNIQVNKLQYNMDKGFLDSKNAMIYSITGDCNLYDRSTENVIVNYKVTKVGFLYLTEGYGEG